MHKTLPLVLRHIMYSLRGGFLVRPLIIALTLGCAGAVLSWIEETVPGSSSWVPAVLFPSAEDPQTAQVILGGIATSIMTVVSIVFAILLMTLTLASMQFSPRIIISFVKDRVTQWTLGVFLGTFSYCMAALPAARSAPKPFAPVATVVGAMLLAFACVCWLLFFIHHVSQAISVGHIVDRIASETEDVIREMMPWPHKGQNLSRDDTVQPDSWTMPVFSQKSGYIRFIDLGRLILLTKANHVKVHVVRRVGQFVPARTPLLMVYKGERLSQEKMAEFHSAFDLGPSRTLQQDIEFGVLQIVDIALKAISPAVNDPTTAVGCVDQLSRILIQYASGEPPACLLYDPPGVARVSIPWIDFQGLLTSAFEQIRLYSKTDLAVSLRMLRALADIASTTSEPEYGQALLRLGSRIVAGCEETLSEEELKPMRDRLRRLSKLVENAAGMKA